MDILEFAIKMEQDGEKYYTQQAELNQSNSLGTVFLRLAKEEQMHAKVLQNKVNGLPSELNQSEALSEAKNIFSEPGAFRNNIRLIPDQLDVYRVALGNEEKSIALYKQYLAEVTDQDMKTLFEYLIGQEEDHYKILDQLISLIVHAEEWVESAEFGKREEY